MSSTTNQNRFQEELIVFFRNSDILSTSERGVTTVTNTLTSTGTGTVYTLSNTTGVRNIRYVTVAGATQTMYRDLTPSYTAGTIAFTAAPSSGTAVVVNYDKGSADKIYGDLPREDIDRLNYPRLMVKVATGVTKEFALGAGSNITDYMITCQMWSTTIDRLNTGFTDIRNKVINNKKNFYHTPFVTLTGNESMMEDYSRGDKIYTRPVTLTARFVVERTT